MTKDNGKKYITLNDGKDFRTIAKIMTTNGFKMNHATARNQLIQALENLLTNIGQEVRGPKMTQEEVSSLLKDQTIHSHLGEILYAAHHQVKTSKRKISQ